MPANRRHFLQALGAAGLGTTSAEAAATVDRIITAVRALGDKTPEEAARDEAFWDAVRAVIGVEDGYVNLQTAWSGATFRPIQQAVADAWVRLNATPRALQGRQWVDGVLGALRHLSEHVNCAFEELIFTRNTTESLNIVLFGLDLRPGDEIVTTTGDWPKFRGAIAQRAAREGIVSKVIDIPSPVASPDAFVEAFAQAVGPKTRAILLCHVYSSGETPPIRRICDLAHARGVQVVVDGALAFGHVVTDLRALGCDYYGASFHKMAGGPPGTGFLYVRQDRIKGLWPLFGSQGWYSGPFHHSEKMFKLAEQGTTSQFLYPCLDPLLRIHDAIGQARRQARLHYLKRSWADRIKDLPGLTFMASLDPSMSCGLVCVRIDGVGRGKPVTPRMIADRLNKEHRIVIGPNPETLFINTSVTTTPQEIDRFVAALPGAIRDASK
jgi:isopenicillin-N epimerase